MKTLALATVLLAATAVPTLAASPFDGTWKTDLKASKMSSKPHTVLVKDGMFKCDCTPPIEIKADGQFHKVTGHPYFDEYSVKVISPREIQSSTRKAGKVLGTDTRTLSADGDIVMESYTDMSAVNGVVVKGTATAKRVAPAPAGALPISGAWVETDGGTSSDAGLTQSFLVKGKTVTNTAPTGMAYTAMLDGPPVKVTGDTGGAMAAVTMTGPRTLVETDTIGGVPQVVYTYAVQPDGKTMDITIVGQRSKRVTKLVARKQ